MATVINDITQMISTISPLMKTSEVINIPTDEDAFVAAYEANNDDLVALATELQTFRGQLNTTISQLNVANSETENNANIAASIGNYQGEWSDLVTYSKSMGVSVGDLYYISKVNNNLNHNVTDTNFWTPSPANLKTSLRSTNITVNVGAGQTYTTINQALEYLSGFYPMYKKGGITATINLKAGFVMAEQVLVSGIDLGWITIVGEDAETIIIHTALTAVFNLTNFPAFGVDKGGTSPTIGQLFRFNVEKVGEGKHGLMAFGAGSSANVLDGKGFIGAGTFGIYAHQSSTINATGANCSNAGTYGIFAYQRSTINANGANCSGAGSDGIFAYRCSTINANGANCSNAGGTGIYTYEGSTINANGANCSNAGSGGITAIGGSTVNANAAIIQNQTTGTARVLVQNGSSINARGINASGGTVPVFSQAVNTLTSQGIIYQ